MEKGDILNLELKDEKKKEKESNSPYTEADD